MGSSNVTDAPTGTGGGVKLDVGADTQGPPPATCKAPPDMDSVMPCTQKAPPDSFEHSVEWEWAGEPGYDESIVTPLVGNLTDDNGDGEVDLCDVPDVVVVAFGKGTSDPGRIFILDGATGAKHLSISEPVHSNGTPALGDIDGDGKMEIVATTPVEKDFQTAWIVAFEHDGTLKWKSDHPWVGAQSSALALADVDGDGDVEVIAGCNLFDHNGKRLWTLNDALYESASTAADLDGDGDLEIIHAYGAVHHDGSKYFSVEALVPQGKGLASYPQVADLDGDKKPDVLFTAKSGIYLYSGATGTSSLIKTAPDVQDSPYGYGFPATVHDFDGDGVAEFAVSSGPEYTAFEGDGKILWTRGVSDVSGLAAGTAFDFIGDGAAEAMYGDEVSIYVFNHQGLGDIKSQRLSGTVIEFPTVADIDNDGSSEILVVSNTRPNGTGDAGFAVQALKDKDNRWIQTRRIWNQHTYHVTNVREDGTIPSVEPKNWLGLNTFRANAQLEGDALCQPQPPG